MTQDSRSRLDRHPTREEPPSRSMPSRLGRPCRALMGMPPAQIPYPDRWPLTREEADALLALLPWEREE